MEWDELRFFHAVAQAGNLSKAARELRVSQPTVGRRIKALEDRLEARLFDRLESGYVLTELGALVFEKTGEMVEVARCIADRATGDRNSVAGTVSLTAPEGLGAAWLPLRLSELNDTHPDLELNVSVSNRMADVSNGESDIAIRMGSPQDEALVGRRVGSVPFRLFASPSYIEKHGCPCDVTDIRHHRIIECGGTLRNVVQAKRLREFAPGARIAATLDDIRSQAAAARAGLGLVALPPYLAAGRSDLVTVLADAFLVEVPIWILTRQDLRTSRRICVVKDALTRAARDFSWGDRAVAPVNRADHDKGGEVVPIRPAIAR